VAYLTPTPRETRTVLAFAAVLILASAVLAPFAGISLGQPITAFVPAIDAIICLVDLLTAGLLLTYFRLTRSTALWALACGYLYSATLVILHALTFSGVLSPTGNIFGGVHTNFKIYLLWHFGLPMAVFFYIWLGNVRYSVAGSRAAIETFITVSFVAVIVLISCFSGLSLLPPIDPEAGKWLTAVAIAISAAALVALCLTRRSVLDQWLAVVMLTMVLELTITALIGGRGPRTASLGFYTGRLLALTTSTVVLISLLTDASRLYAFFARASLLGNIVDISQNLSVEIESAPLIDLLIRTALEHASADRGLLILPSEQGDYLIRAEALDMGDEIVVMARQSPIAEGACPESFIREVIHSKKSAVLTGALPTGDASREVQEGHNILQARSILCVPIERHGVVSGLLYLEHTTGANVFSPERVRLLELLASQAAISLENARLVGELRARERDNSEVLAQLIAGESLSKTGSFTSEIQTDQQRWSEELYRIYEIDPSTPPSIEAVRGRIHPDDLEKFNAEIRRRMEGGESDFVFRIVTPTARVKHLRAVVRLAEYAAGRPLFMGAIQDITESKVAEAALTASETELRRANRYLNEAQRISRTGSFTWDPQQSEMDWSEGLFRILDFDLDTTPDLARLTSTIHPDDIGVVESTLLDAARNGNDYEMFYRINTRTAGVRHLHTTGQRLPEITDRNVFIGATQDITQRVLTEEALNRTRGELAHVTRVATLNAMTASIAHEVSQPISGILTNANTGLRMLAAEPPNLAGAAETARRTIRDANRASDVLKRLREMFSGKEPITELVDLDDATRDVIAISAGELGRRRARVQTELADGLLPVRADRVQLQQVILNLLLNAADAMEGIEDRPRTLLIRTQLEQGAVRLDVRDAGKGFDPAATEKLFEPFHTTKRNGMGVGLSICRSIIEKHEGRIWATLNDGPGATFSFSLPTAVESVGASHQPPVSGEST
jgi:signal transduction histidine kinase